MMSLRGLSVARLSCSLRGGEEASSYTDSVFLPRNGIEGIMRVARNSGSHAEGGGRESTRRRWHLFNIFPFLNQSVATSISPQCTVEKKKKMVVPSPTAAESIELFQRKRESRMETTHRLLMIRR